MAFPHIVSVVEYAERLYAQARKPVTFSIQTNAYNVTPPMVAFFRDHQFSVRVSLDGTKEAHDRSRRTRGGGRTYDRVVAGIRNLRAANLEVDAVCVVHAANVHTIVDMYDAMAELGVGSIVFLPVFKSGNADDTDWLDGDTYFDAYFDVIEHVLDRTVRGASAPRLSTLTAGELGSLQSFRREFMCMRSPCGAGTNMVAIDVNADVYPCEEMIGKPEFVVGNLRRESLKAALDHHPVALELKRRHVDEIEECSRCTWKQMCHGGCVQKSYTHFKRLDRESEHCSYYKRIYRELIWLEAERPGSWATLAGEGGRRAAAH
jgi:uncharacterized protein